MTKIRDKQCGPNRHNKRHLLITSANKLDRDQARRKNGPDLDPNCLTLLWKENTVRYSITAFCHVSHLYTRAISALKFEADKECFSFCQIYFCTLWALISKAYQRRFYRADSTRNSEAHRIGGNIKKLELPTNEDKEIVSNRVFDCNLSPNGNRKHCF